MHYIQCYMYSYVIKLFKLALSKIVFLFRFTYRFRGMMKLLRICVPLRPCLIHVTLSVCFIMERQIDNVTHAFFFHGFSFQGTFFSFKLFCLLSTELIILDLKYHGDSERTVHWRRIHQSSNACHLEKSSCVKYLGVYIDCHLNWHDHIDYIGSKLK